VLGPVLTRTRETRARVDDDRRLKRLFVTLRERRVDIIEKTPAPFMIFTPPRVLARRGPPTTRALVRSARRKILF